MRLVIRFLCRLVLLKRNKGSLSLSRITSGPRTQSFCRVSCSHLDVSSGGPGRPGSDHHDILRRFELKQLEENIVSAGHNNGGIFLQAGQDGLIEQLRLCLIRNEDEQH